MRRKKNDILQLIIYKARFSESDYLLNHKRERFKIFDVEP